MEDDKMSAETKELLTDIVIPLVTAFLGFLGGLFSGMHIEHKKTKNEVHLEGNAQANDINQSVTTNNYRV